LPGGKSEADPTRLAQVIGNLLTNATIFFRVAVAKRQAKRRQVDA
jgi:signal transduction histidine kinase